MKYLITGGAGFIGSNLVDHIINQGHDVTVIDNESSDAHDNFYWNKKANNYKYDTTDYVMCSDVFKRHHPDYVLHLAAEARIQNCIEDPTKAYETNLIGTLNMLALCKKYEVKRLVLSTTSAIYGLKNIGPLHEDMPADCLNSYSLSKWNAEHACKMYSSMYGVDTACLRYFNVYGPRQPKKGPYAPVIGIFNRQKNEGRPLTVVGDGEQTRDYVHVSDVVNANILACSYNENLCGEIFNVGTGKNYSVNWLASKIEKDVLKIVHILPRIGEARHTIADIKKIQTKLLWNPKINLEEWMNENT
jgi:nucleoside-diphosphate-sugar epimerase